MSETNIAPPLTGGRLRMQAGGCSRSVLTSPVSAYADPPSPDNRRGATPGTNRAHG